MPFSIADLLYGFVIPAFAAAITVLVLRRFLPAEPGQRVAAAVALVGGFWLGYWLLGLGPLTPDSHWHWLPYALLLTGLIGPVAHAQGVSRVERLLLYLFVAGITLWLLVPTWEDLEPSRRVQIIAWSLYIVALAMLLDPLTEWFPGPLLPALLTAVCICGAVVLALSGSLRFAQMLGAGTAALVGIAVAALFKRDQTALRGSALSYAVLSAGSMMVGQVNSFSAIPLASYVLIPASPLALWLCVWGPLARLTGFKGVIVRTVLAMIGCGVALALAAQAELAAGE